MTLQPRWFLPLLLLFILVTNAAVACAEESFLEQFRLQSSPASPVDWYDSGQSSSVNAEAEDDSDLRVPSATPQDSRRIASRTMLEPDSRPHDPLYNGNLFDGPLTDGSEVTGAEAFPAFESYCPPEFDSCETPLIRYRETCFQGTQAAYGIIPESSSGLGIGTLDLLGTFAIPLGSMDHLISFMPFFRLDGLSAPATLDVPNELYEVGVKTFWKRAVNERLTTMVLFTPSVRSDFDSSEQAFKLFGSAMLSWKIAPDKLSIFGGAMYTGREDYPVLPTMGIYWTPSPLWKFDIQFPSPRISRRIVKDVDFCETWAYVSGVFGGNTWAVKRASSQDDQLTLRDLRLMLGVEYLRQRNRGVFVETGWVFSRSMEYTNTPGQIDFGDAIILRAGIQF